MQRTGLDRRKGQKMGKTGGPENQVHPNSSVGFDTPTEELGCIDTANFHKTPLELRHLNGHLFAELLGSKNAIHDHVRQ